MTHLILIGKPGSGKGTISSYLKDLGYTHISTGDVLRAEKERGTELGKQISALIDKGNFVPDALAVQLTISNTDENVLTVFDGFPRTKGQAALFNAARPNLKYIVIHFKIEDEAIVERLTNRRTCPDCKTIYNLKNLPPKKEDTCDVCSHVGLDVRQDDTANVINQRLSVYNKTFPDLLNYFNQQGVVKEVDANQSSDLVLKQVKQILNKP